VVQHAKNKSSPPYLAGLEIFALRPSSVFRQSQKVGVLGSSDAGSCIAPAL
jgi:hypothetical protein